MKRIVICGYMGVGKTTIGKLVSEKIKIPFFDLDQLITIHESSSVKQIFEAKGEIYFRKLEHEVLSNFLKSNKEFVLSLGGGTPLYYNNSSICFESNEILSVYLEATLELLVDRLIVESADRPIISHIATKNDLEDFIRKHLFERHHIYAKAKHKVKVDAKTPNDISNEIINLMS